MIRIECSYIIIIDPSLLVFIFVLYYLIKQTRDRSNKNERIEGE